MMGPTESLATAYQPVVSAASETPVYHSSASVFLHSNNINTYIESAREIIATVLEQPESEWLRFGLPHNLTLFHMACLASDDVFLLRLLNMPEFTARLCQPCSAIDDDVVALLDPASGRSILPAINRDPPLHFALLTSFTKGVKIIIAAMKERDQLLCPTNATGNNSFHLAAGRSSVECMQLLCDNFRDEALINQVTHRGSTPLHLAARNGSPDVFLLLVHHGAVPSLTVRDLKNSTPIDIIGSNNADARAREERAFYITNYRTSQYNPNYPESRVPQLFARLKVINEDLLNVTISPLARSNLDNDKEAVMNEISRWEEIVLHASALALAHEVNASAGAASGLSLR